MKEIGFSGPLFILAFDHRASFSRDLLGITGEPTVAQVAKIKQLKEIIFSGFKKAIASDIPKTVAAVLVDEQYGTEILSQAGHDGFNFILSVEKSGQNEFTLEYGQDFAAHIDKFKPPFVKALVRYNPEGDLGLNQRQLEKLKKFSDWCVNQPPKFLIELLVPATDEQLTLMAGDKSKYDLELRPNLTVTAVKHILASGVKADVWKIEGMDGTESYKRLVQVIKTDGQENVNMVVLGRGENLQHMESWLRAAKGVDGITGFAIGRTIFWEPLKGYLSGKLSADQANSNIAKNYIHFYNFFNA